MRLDGISIENFLSFERLEWTNLDPRLNLIVGPNGAGKTNFIHALRAVTDTLNYMRRSELPWEQSFHRGATSRAIRIALDVAFTGAWERQLFRTFVGAALCDALKRHQQYNANQVHRQELPGLSTFLEEHIQIHDLEWLFSGQLVVTYGETNNRWHSWYESRPGEPFFQLSLDSPTGSSMLIGDEVLTRFLNPLIVQGWHPTLLYVEPASTQDQQPEASSKEASSEQEKQSDTPVSAEAVYPTESSSEMEATPIQEQPEAFAADETQSVILSAAEAVSGEAHPLEKPPDPSQPETQYDIGRLLSTTFQGKGLYLEVSYPQEYVLATHQAFEQVTGEPFELSKNFNADYVFRRLFERAFVFTDNMRRAPKHGYMLEELRTEASDLSNGEGVAGALFRKMTGQTQRERDEYRTIRKTFEDLTGKQFELSVSYPALMGQPRPSAAKEADLLLNLLVTSHWDYLPLEFSGAGFTEALFLSTLIASENDQVIFLDEPALNLHPTMQRKLLEKLQAHTGNQFVIVTHSPALIPTDTLGRVSRFFLANGKTFRAALEKGVNRADLAKIERELRNSSDVRAMLFSRGVILVEGDTEQEVFPLWYEKRFGVVLDTKDILIYSVGGDTHFEPYVRFLQQLKVPWAIVCDGPVINRGPTGMSRQLARAGVESVPDVRSMTFGERLAALAPCGVFTLAGEDTPEIEQAPSIKRILDEASKGMRSQNKVRKGRYIAENFSCPEEVAALLQRAEQHLLMREAAIGAGEALAREGIDVDSEDQPFLEELTEEDNEAVEVAAIGDYASRGIISGP